MGLNRRSFLALVAGTVTGVVAVRWIVRPQHPLMMQVAARVLARWKHDRNDPTGMGDCQITRFEMPMANASTSPAPRN